MTPRPPEPTPTLALRRQRSPSAAAARARFRALCCALALTVAAIAAPEVARADEPSPEEMAEARTHFEKARRHEAAGEYVLSADEYLSAYALYPDPEFFFNVGRVYRLAKKPKKAIEYYRKYLELDPEGRGADKAREQVEVLRRKVGERGGAPGPGRAPEPASGASRAGDVGTPGPLDPASGGEVHGAAPEDPNRNRGLRVAAYAAGGVGVAALAGSLLFGLQAQSLSDELSDKGPGDSWTDADFALIDDGKRANTAMMVFAGIGGAAVTTGVVLYVLSQDDGGAESRGGLAVSPALSPSHVGVSLGGHF